MVLSMTSTDANADANADADADNTNCDQQHNHDHADDDPCVTKENAEISATATATSICCTTDDDSNNNGDDIAITPTTAAAVTTGVRFNDEVGVHAHNTVLGYHPDTIEGPPVQLGWKYQTRTSTLHNVPSKPIEYLSKETREETLTESGFRQSEMDQAVEEVQQIHSSRLDNASIRPTTRSITSTASSSSFRATVVNHGHRGGAKMNYSASSIKKNLGEESLNMVSAALEHEQKQQQHKKKKKKGKNRWFLCWRS
mmetsp:Transcript_29959/g.30451  ORF Transcript_29959/g.30451 Transcript_29959/m.30451 type:complete len:256 (+) Transcript_29959:101-868(+)